jgi:hypothetical protein
VLQPQVGGKIGEEIHKSKGQRGEWVRDEDEDENWDGDGDKVGDRDRDEVGDRDGNEVGDRDGDVDGANVEDGNKKGKEKRTKKGNGNESWNAEKSFLQFFKSFIPVSCPTSYTW